MGKDILMAKSHGDFIMQIESREGLIYVVVTDGRRLRDQQVPDQAAGFRLLGDIAGNLDKFLTPPEPPAPAPVPTLAAVAAPTKPIRTSPRNRRRT